MYRFQLFFLSHQILPCLKTEEEQKFTATYVPSRFVDVGGNESKQTLYEEKLLSRRQVAKLLSSNKQTNKKEQK